MILSAGLASAQIARISESAPVVNITASGDRVKAAGAAVTVEGSAQSVKVTGANVTVRGEVNDNVRAVGAKVVINADVGGEVRAAGASVEVRGRVANGIDAAGAVVVVNAVTGGALRVGGAIVTIGPGSEIGQGLKVGGATVTVSGKIDGVVEIGAAAVTFNARTTSDVTVYGGQVIINAPARIGGDLIVRSRFEPVIAEGAVIAGKVRTVEPPRWWWPISPWAWAVILVVAIAAGTILAGVVLLLFGGRVFVTATDHVRLRPGSSILIGVATAILIPAIAVILVATLIGLTAGLAILMILPLLVVFGHAVAAAGIASGVFVRGRGPLGAFTAFVLLLVGAVLVALIALIPWVGPVLGGLVVLLGMGALTRTLGSRIRRAEPQPV